MLGKDKIKRYTGRFIKKIMQEDKNLLETESFKQKVYVDKDKNHIWIFTSGDKADSFQGNPKYLFVYINKYRKDISAYWLTISEEMAEYIRSFGYKAYADGSVEAEYIKSKAGVLVAEHVKIVIPSGLENAKYLNLYHGVGSKPVEHSISEGPLFEGIAKKYIKHNQIYRNQQLFLATSPLIEENFKQQCFIDDDKIIRAGYPRCLYQKYYDKIATFDHDLKRAKGLDEDVRLAVYAPTFRPDDQEVFNVAIPDIEKLIDCCRDNNILLIFKMHPKIENEYSFLLAKEKYGECPYLYFWDNKYDFYEIIDQIDLAIVDYSSIINDLLAAGLRHVIRYVYDFEEYKENIIYDFDEVTTGKKCFDFNSLLSAICDFEQSSTEDVDRILKMYWQYSNQESFDTIIDQTLAFEIDRRELPTLYSFDIFDTLFTRKVLRPSGIFQYVEYKIKTSREEFPLLFSESYVNIRRWAESNAREFYRKTTNERNTECIEISFDMIFERMTAVYGLNEKQVELLKQWEIEAELDNVLPISENIEQVKELIAQGENVILISDMYLDKAIIQKMLYKADPVLNEIPLFLSSEYGVQKSGLNLFKEVYKSYEPTYGFGKWIHSGDNMHSDVRMPNRLGILSRKIEPLQFNKYENDLANFVDSYDGTMCAAMMARFRKKCFYEKDEFAFSFVSLCFVPYINWVLRDAVKRGYEKLYFLSRDGYQLQRIADKIIEIKHLPIKTKYIYGSRRAWRIPSYIDDIDIGFWGGYGNFVKITSKEKLLKAMDLTEDEFVELFPMLKDLTDEEIQKKNKMSELVDMFKNSHEYRTLLLKKAKEQRKSVCGYLRQEIDASEKFAVVEFWGRGYTQECFTRLWHEAAKTDEKVAFYYARTVLPTEGNNIRYNFTTNSQSLLFIESIFANIPYKSIEKYNLVDGNYEPEIVKIPCDMELYYAMKRDLLLFAEQFAKVNFCDVEMLEQKLFDFVLEAQKNSVNYPVIVSVLSRLYDSVEMFGKKHEYAPLVSYEQIEAVRDGAMRNQFTSNMNMSFARVGADNRARDFLMDLYQFDEGDDFNRGKKLTPAEYKRKKNFEEQYDNVIHLHAQFVYQYNCLCEKVPVSNKIVFVTEEINVRQPEFTKLMDLIDGQQNKGISYSAISLSGVELKDIKRIAHELADAKWIIIAQRVKIFGQFLFRAESKLIMLGYSAYPYLKIGCCRNYYVKIQDRFNKMIWDNDVKVLQRSSECLNDYYKQIYNIRDRIEYIDGCCSTDVFFDENYKKNAFKKLYRAFPEAKGKKVIAYIPSIKYKNEKIRYLDMLDMGTLKKLIGDEYVVILHQRQEVRKLHSLYEVNIKGFSSDLTDVMRAREQLSVADVVIGDYRDVYFESAVVRKPIFSYAYDAEKFCEKSPAFEYYENICLGPIVASEEEFARYLSDLDNYDYRPQDRFREKYLKYCDGKSTERLWGYICEDAKRIIDVNEQEEG